MKKKKVKKCGWFKKESSGTDGREGNTTKHTHLNNISLTKCRMQFVCSARIVTTAPKDERKHTHAHAHAGKKRRKKATHLFQTATVLGVVVVNGLQQDVAPVFVALAPEGRHGRVGKPVIINNQKNEGARQGERTTQAVTTTTVLSVVLPLPP